MSADPVDLTQLRILRRYGLALRQGEAERAEVVAALQADLADLQRPAAAPPTPTAARRPSPRAGSRPTPRGTQA